MWVCEDTLWTQFSLVSSSVGRLTSRALLSPARKDMTEKWWVRFFSRTRKIEECACGIPQCPFTVIVRQLHGTEKCVRLQTARFLHHSAHCHFRWIVCAVVALAIRCQSRFRFFSPGSSFVLILCAFLSFKQDVRRSQAARRSMRAHRYILSMSGGVCVSAPAATATPYTFSIRRNVEERKKKKHNELCVYVEYQLVILCSTVSFISLAAESVYKSFVQKLKCFVWFRCCFLFRCVFLLLFLFSAADASTESIFRSPFCILAQHLFFVPRSTHRTHSARLKQTHIHIHTHPVAHSFSM